MKTVVSICVIATILVSCVPSKHFKMVVSDNEFYHDTVAQLNKMSRAQHGQIDSLEQALQLKQQIYSSDLSQKEQELETREQELAEKEKTMEELKNIVGLQQQAVYNLKQQVCDALKCFTPDELNVEIKNGKLYVSLSDKLLFPSGSDKVDDRGKEAIKQLSGVLKES